MGSKKNCACGHQRCTGEGKRPSKSRWHDNGPVGPQQPPHPRSQTLAPRRAVRLQCPPGQDTGVLAAAPPAEAPPPPLLLRSPPSPQGLNNKGHYYSFKIPHDLSLTVSLNHHPLSRKGGNQSPATFKLYVFIPLNGSNQVWAAILKSKKPPLTLPADCHGQIPSVRGAPPRPPQYTQWLNTFFFFFNWDVNPPNSPFWPHLPPQWSSPHSFFKGTHYLI